MPGRVLSLLFILLALVVKAAFPQAIPVTLNSRIVEESQTTLNEFMGHRAARVTPGWPDSLKRTYPPHMPHLWHATLTFDDFNEPLYIIGYSDSSLQASDLWMLTPGADASPALKRNSRAAKDNNRLHAYVDVAIPESLSHIPAFTSTLELRFLPARRVLLYRLADYRVGEALFDGKSRQVALVRRPEEFFFHASKAMVVIDRDGNGQWMMRAHLDSSGTLFAREAFPASRPFFLDGVPYRNDDVSLDGNRLSFSRGTDSTLAALGFLMPDVHAFTLAGDSLSLRKFRGKTMVINWWATGCPHCVEEMPGLNRLVAKYRGNDSVVFVSVAWNTPEELREFLKDHTFDYAITCTTAEPAQVLGETFPRHLIVDPTGRIVFDETGGYEGRYKELDAALRKITSSAAFPPQR